MAISGFINFIDCAALKIYALPEAEISVTNGTVSKTLGTDDVFEVEAGWKTYVVYIQEKDFGTWTVVSTIGNTNKQKTITINHFSLYTISLMLPNEYEQIEYIQSSGTQRINTGISPLTTRWGFEIDFTPLNSITNTGYAIFGTQTSGHEWHLNCWTGGTSRLGTLIMNATSYDAGLIQNTRIQCELHNLLYKSSTGKVATITDASVNNLPLYLFCKNNNSTLQENSSMRLYSFRLYDDENNMVLNLIPGIRKADSVVGLWDCVSETFFTNVGTGTFAAGSRIDNKYSPLYLYNRGNENLSITGGFEAKNSDSRYQTSGATVTKNKTDILLKNVSNASIAVTTKNKIDVTNYGTLEFIAYRASSAGDSSYYGLSSTGLPDASGAHPLAGSLAAGSWSTDSANPTIRTLDISSLTGSYYVWFGGLTSNGIYLQQIRLY